ncbi:MAG: hypothetical protein U9N76_05220 [Candidatus Marinimicrobia bacterium]|nr:hypothetical protein [Candidatus Neomarinimicrobiota bacterium]
MKFELKNIHLWPVFKMTFFVTTVFMLLFLLIFGKQFIAMFQSMSELSSVDVGAINFGFFALLSMAFIFGLELAILNTIIVVLYNLFSQWLGGVVVEFEGDWEIVDGEEKVKNNK